MRQNGYNQKKSDTFRQIGALTTVPFIMALGPLIGFYMGGWIDRKTGFAPYGTAIFIALGFAASVRETVRMIRDVLKQQ